MYIKRRCLLSFSGGAEARHRQATERKGEGESCYHPGCSGDGQSSRLPLIPSLSLDTFLSQLALGVLDLLVP